MHSEIFLGVGSNLLPREHILQALALLQERVAVLASSRFYRTLPLEGREQPAYCNGVWRIGSSLTPRELKQGILRPTEAAIGRRRQADRYASRTIDLDLLLYGELQLDLPGLQLPDPDICRRNFIALPLFELQPQLRIPGSGRPLAEIVQTMDESGMEYLADFTAELRQRISARSLKHSPSSGTKEQ